jgi:thymidylate kinase
LLITFSGLDGAGKSTQIFNLRHVLKSQGLRTSVLSFWDNVAVLQRLREGFVHRALGSQRGTGAPGHPVNRRDKNVRAWYLTLLRHLVYLLDAVKLRWVLHRACGNAEVIIFDRYIHDELANLPLQNPVTRAFVHAISRLSPRPDLAYLLDADPVAARARKPEYPVDFLQHSRMNYYRLAALLKTLTLVPPLPEEEARRAVEEAFMKLLRQMPMPPAQAGPEIPSPGLPR